MKYFLILAIFLCSITTIKAQEEDSIFNLSLEALMNIEVFSSNKKAENIIETPAVIDVITAEEIQLLNFNTLEQVLEYSVGLASVNGEGNVFTTTTIRGNTLVNYNTNTLLLYDGIPIFNAYHGSFDFQAIPLSSIERIEIVKGSNSVLYGSNAMNGVINIVSKKVATNESEYQNVSARAKYGDFNTLYFNGAIITKRDDWEFNLFVDVLDSDGEFLPFKDENGNEMNLKKAYKGLSTVSKIAYKNMSLTMQYYNRDTPGVRTRAFKRIYTSSTDLVGILTPEYSDENALIVNFQYFRDLSDNTRLDFRTNVMNWNLQKKLYNGYWDYSSMGLYNDLSLTINSSESFSNKAGVSYNHYIGRRYKSQNDAYDIGLDEIWTDDISIFINGEYQIFEPL